MLQRYLFIGLFLVLQSVSSWAQEFTLQIWPDSTAALLKNLPKKIADSSAVQPVLESIIDQLRWQGHLESAIDQVQLRDSTIYIKLHLGPVYHWLPLNLEAIPENLIRSLGFQKFRWEKTPVRLTQLQNWQQQILDYAENNGYPFAAIQLEPFLTEKNKLGGRLRLGLGPNIRLDTLEIKGNLELSTFYVQSYLGLEPGQAFNQEKFDQSEKRLRDLPFVQVKERTELQFFKDKVRPVFHLQKKKASRFDCIIGVLPNNTQTGRLLVTGDLEGELINAFVNGERLYAHFEQLRPATQELELALSYPYLFRLPFGTDLAFNIYKRDSSFLDVELDIGVQYLLEGGNYLKFFWQQLNSNLLNINEALLTQQQALPQ
ncbi:MAG: POTRA domain-containing protein, partial [Bacteroidota bacterium]